MNNPHGTDLCSAYIFGIRGFSPPRIWPEYGKEQNLAGEGNNQSPLMEKNTQPKKEQKNIKENKVKEKYNDYKVGKKTE